MAGSDLVPVEQYAALAPERGGIEILREHLAGAEVSEFDLDRVKMPSGGGTSWEVPTLEGSEARKSIDGVVVFFKNSRSYWKDEYSGGNEPPDCSSADGIHAVRNNDEVDIPASKEEGYLLCDTCALSEWGSAPGGGRGQACKMTRQLFVLTSEKLLPLVVSLPPTSLATAQRYFLSLADHMLDYKAVVTSIGLEKISGKGVPDYSRATFKMAGQVTDPAMVESINQYAASLRPQFDRVRTKTREEVGAAA